MKMLRKFIAVGVAVALFFSACTLKNTDIRAEIETKLKTVPGITGAAVDVTNGIVTLTGESTDIASKTNCEKIVQQVEGVKTVINDLTVAGLPENSNKDSVTAPVVAVPLDTTTELPVDPFTKSVLDITKNYPSVEATVKDKVITLTGEIRKGELPVLLSGLNALKPKKIVRKLTVSGTTPARRASVKAKVKSKTKLKQKTVTKKRHRGH